MSQHSIMLAKSWFHTSCGRSRSGAGLRIIPLPTWNFELGTWNRRPRRPGYTLTELLIVIFIMVILVSITLPTVKRVMEDGNVREASRQFNAYLAMAKARALQTGRPCGIMLRCDLPVGITADPPLPGIGFPDWTQRIVTQMYLAEVPPPYSGSTMGAVGKIWPGGPAGLRIFDSSSGELPYVASLVEEGEFFLVRFNFKGEWYRCLRGIGPNAGIFAFLDNTSMTKPPGYNDTNPAGGSPFQILRMPRRIGNPLELSTGTCIDLAYSGIGPSNLPSQTIQYGMYPTPLGNPPAGLFPGTPPAPPRLQYLTVMFQPDGGIESVFLNNYFFAPATTVHFLVGRSDKVNPPYGSSTHGTGVNMYDPNTSNLADPLSLWVSVSRTTGNVNTSENSPPSTDLGTITSNSMRIISGTAAQIINPSNTGDQALYLALCRQLATNREQIRGQ